MRISHARGKLRKRSRHHARRFTQLLVEPLEGRRMLADLNLTSIQLVRFDDKSTPATPVVGEEICVLAQWQYTNVPNVAYRLQFNVDGVTGGPSGILAGTNSTSYPLCGWFASPGEHNVQVTVDADNTIAETDETNNSRSFSFSPSAPTTLLQKFGVPIGGVTNRDWTIINYNDVDPTSGSHDFQNGPYTYDGHDAYDIGLSNFAEMDSGIPIYAAADGVVSTVQDGNFDRNTVRSDAPANYVLIDLGNGWQTQYLHFQANTITVKVGDAVKAGQLLGLVGSDGICDGPHLHFAVKHFGASVEPEYDSADYFINPLPYAGTQPTVVNDIAVTSFNPTDAETEERPATQSVFSTSTPQTPRLAFYVDYLPANEPLVLKQYRPDGTLYASSLFTQSSTIRAGFFWQNLGGAPISSFPGTWRMAIEKNGVELASTTFEVTDGPGAAGIKVNAADGTPLSDNRTTRWHFGQTAQGNSPLTQTFTITNPGSVPLTLSDLTLPPGFVLSGTFLSSVAAGASADFTVNATTDRVGDKFGAIQFTTNDPDTPLFNFNVAASITGQDNPLAPQITLPAAATPYLTVNQAVAIDPTTTVTDSNSSNMDGGSLTVEFSAVSSSQDTLGIGNDGTGAGQIGTNGTTVTFAGTPIGTFTGGSAGTPLKVVLNANADLAAVQALARNITFSTSALKPETLSRYIRFTVVDGAGNVSTQPLAVVVQDLTPASINLPPTLDEIFDPQAVLEDAAAQTISLLDISAGGRESQHLTITAVSDNPTLIPNPTITYTSPNNTGSLTYKLAPDQFGTAIITVTVTVKDDGGADNGGIDTFTQTFTVIVTPVNDPPSFEHQAGNYSAYDENLATHGPALQQIVSGWATNISVGPVNESDQTPSWEVTNDNHAVFTADGQPAIDATGNLTYTPRPNAHGTARVTVILHDSGDGTNASAAVNFAIEIVKKHRLHNSAEPGNRTGLDVTGSTSLAPDGFIAANDVLAVINYINAHPGTGQISDDSNFGPSYPDVTGDGFVAADDVVAIINWINAHPGQSEGEADTPEASMALFETADQSISSSMASAPLPSASRSDTIALLAADIAATQAKRRRLSFP